MASVCVRCRRLGAKVLHRGPASPALQIHPRFVRSGVVVEMLSGTPSENANSFFRKKKNDLKVADVARWEGVTMKDV